MKILFILFMVFGALSVAGAKWANRPGQPADDYSAAFPALLSAILAVICFGAWVVGLIIHYLFG